MTNASEKGRDAARHYARWYIGDPSWADSILHAYFNPEDTIAELREEGAFK